MSVCELDPNVWWPTQCLLIYDIVTKTTGDTQRSKFKLNITKMSHNCHEISNHRQLDSLFNKLLLTTKKTPKLPFASPAIYGGNYIPFQSDSNVKSDSITCRHHDVQYIEFELRWKFHSTLIEVVVKWSLWHFEHGTTVVLSSHVQNCIAIWYTSMSLHLNQFSIEFELWWKTRS